MSNAFIEFSFASDAAWKTQLEAYNRCEMLLRTRGGEMGLDPSLKISELDEVGKELFAGWYESDPKLVEMGPINLTQPPPAPPNRILIHLFTDKVPKTTENFLRLCDGTKGFSKTAKTKPLHYLHTRVHRIVRNFCVQMGDITRGDGSGGDSIYGGKFNDEKAGFKVGVEVGSVVMANSGKNSNTSQFFVVLPGVEKERMEGLVGKYVVFGKVVEGLEVLERINGMGREVGSKDESPVEEITISNCGVV
ncbi:hypothetical protein HDU97_004125 [Phlyctochytrium planicorne]|nr:hypothetical protein HDU97_004125 [Phlyctochytrium planicorne]